MKLECPSCHRILELKDYKKKFTISGGVVYYNCPHCGAVAGQTECNKPSYGIFIDVCTPN